MLFEHQYQFSKRMQMHDITEIVKQDIDPAHFLLIVIIAKGWILPKKLS